MDRFDRLFWRRLWRLVKPYWSSERKWQGYALLAMIVAVGGLTVALAAYATYINRDLVNAIQAHDRRGFWLQIKKFLLYAVIFVPITAYLPWLIGRLTIVWREWMTDRFIAHAFANRAFYRIVTSGQVDNPDQRISEDVGAFTGTTLSLLLTFLNSPVTGTTFFIILWSISPKLAMFLLFYALAGTWAAVLVGRRLVLINFNQQRYEADFRFGLVHVRDNAEPIAMYGGEQYEQRQLRCRFTQVVDNFNLLIRWTRNLALVAASYNGPAHLLPWFLLAGSYFAGRISFGQFNQAAVAFLALKGAISFVVEQFGTIANYATVVNRLAQFDEQCESAAGRLDALTPALSCNLSASLGASAELARPRLAGAGAAGEGDKGREQRLGQIVTEQDSHLTLEALTLETPDRQRTLIRDLSVTMRPGGRLLVRGESGTGKTSLLRAIAGLWTTGIGRIVRPALGEAMFVPQRPYLVLGTLRDQLCYPRAMGASDEDLLRALAEANLAELPVRAGGLDAERNWPDFLSPGEQQRLAFARLLIRRPAFAFLDEATSALDATNEALIYERLSTMNISVLSVGHRQSLLKYHERVLELVGDSTWCLFSTSGELGPWAVTGPRSTGSS